MSFQGLLKALCGLFLLIGGGLVLYAGYGLVTGLLQAYRSTGTGEARFVRYRGTQVSKRRHSHEVQASPLFYYATFEWQGRQIEDPTPQLVRWYDSGQALPVLLPGKEGPAPQLAAWSCRYLWYLAVLLFGGLLLLPPVLFLLVFPGAAATAATEAAPSAALQLPEGFGTVDTPLGRLSLISVAKGMGALLVLGVVAGLWSEYGPHLVFGKDREMLAALRRKDTARALELARAGEGVNAVDEYRRTPLILAMEAEQWELAEALIAAGADPNVESKMLRVPLMMAAKARKDTLCAALLAKGARVDPGPEGPLFLAVAANDRRVLQALLAAGPDLTGRYEELWTLADVAVFLGYAQVLDLLEAAGVPVTAPEPCVWVARNDQKKVQEVLATGAEAARRTLDVRCGRRSLIELAEAQQRRALVRLLKRAGLDAE